MTSNKALIVDDSRLAQFVLKKMLVELDYEVDTAESGEEALNYLVDHKPSVIFLDHSMPGMNGLEALQIMKGRPSSADISVIMYTSQDDPEYPKKAQKLGALGVVPKQLSIDDLKQSLALIKPASDKPESQTDSANQQILEALVEDAESVISFEDMEVQHRKQLEQQRDKYEMEISTLHERTNQLIPAAENNHRRQSFWNNVLWASIYCITAVGFILLYQQQKTTIDQLTDRVASSRPIQEQVVQAPVTTEPQSAEIPTAIAATAEDTNEATPEAITALQDSLNTNNQIPLGEQLLSDTAIAILNELIPELTELNFRGRVSLIAHDGTFCVSTGVDGRLQLADDDAIATQCEMTDASERLADISSLELLNTIIASNQTNGESFKFIIDPRGANQPLEIYPDLTEEVNAGQWNDIAMKNRRLEFELVPFQ